MSATPSAASLLMWIETVDSIYQQELGRPATHGELAHYLDAIMRLGHTGDLIRAEVRAVRPPAPAWTLPTRVEVLANLRADIDMRDDGDRGEITGRCTPTALWWDDERFAAFAARYVNEGNRLLPCSMRVRGWQGYDFDLASDVPLLIARLDRAHAAGLIPMLSLDCYDERGRGAETVARLPGLLRQLRGHLAACFTGWEIEVAGDQSLYTYDEHLRVIEIARETIPEIVIGVEFHSNQEPRTEPITFDGRGPYTSAGPYWQRTAAWLADVMLLELPYPITDDRHKVCEEVGGVICRFQGQFPEPTTWPEGGNISEFIRGNWRMDYHVYKAVMLFEFAAYQRWPTSRKLSLRKYVQQVFPMLDGYGEG